SNGLTFDPDGQLTICQHGNRRVICVEPHGNIIVLADRYAGKRLNSPNDLVYRSDGTLFFTDPPFGLPGGFGDASSELPFSGLFRVQTAAVPVVTAERSGPSGIAVAPDEHRVCVSNADAAGRAVMRYAVSDAGYAAGSTVVLDRSGAEGEGSIGGIKVDTAG